MPYHIFGPVPSRRLGRSLGVDLVPYKTCSFDCIYCELGPTTCHTKNRSSYKDIDTICDELKSRLIQLEGELDYITLAGSGEPTLNSDLGSIIDRIKSMTHFPLAILTNSSLFYDPFVRDELKSLDLVVPSLDAVNSKVFQKINRPVEGIEIERIIEGLIKFREEFIGNIWLEVLVCEGINDDDTELALIKKAVQKINPQRVQINTVFRPPSIDGIRPVSEKRLKQIENFMGQKAQAVGSFQIRKGNRLSSRSLMTRTLMMLKRRPCNIEDISSALCMERIEVIKLLGQMMKLVKISKICYQGTTYYKVDYKEEIPENE